MYICAVSTNCAVNLCKCISLTIPATIKFLCLCVRNDFRSCRPPRKAFDTLSSKIWTAFARFIYPDNSLCATTTTMRTPFARTLSVWSISRIPGTESAALLVQTIIIFEVSQLTRTRCFRRRADLKSGCTPTSRTGFARSLSLLVLKCATRTGQTSPLCLES